MLAGAISNLSLSGIAPIPNVAVITPNTGLNAPRVGKDALMGINFDPQGWEGVFLPYCTKCGRYYNPKSPHLCFPDDISLEDERRKLKKWLGKAVETIE